MSDISIIGFIEDPNLINDQSLSVAQKMSLKVIYGESLTDEELKIFKQTTGLKRYREGTERTEATFILGRRSGKSDKLASNIALFEACSRSHRLSVGQTGVVMVVASEKNDKRRLSIATSWKSSRKVRSSKS